jgi:hypothetical protein
LRALASLKSKLSPDALASEAVAAVLLADCLEIAAGKAGDCGLGDDWEESFRQVCADSLDVVSAAADRNALFLALGRLGWDDRPGVGLDEQGMPDILWLPVPAQEAPAFYIARYPVTQVQFQAFIDAEDGYADPRWWVDFAERQGEPSQPSWPEPNAPRTDVDWFEAIAFCRWLTDCGKSPGTGWEMLLPTDEQWRQAYVGASMREFPWQGEPDPNRHANYGETGLERNSAVGVFPSGVASSGALDMAGNIWEWCLEKYDRGADKVGSPVLDASDDRRVLRGGSWGSAPDGLRSAYRARDYPVGRDLDLGFRLVCRPPSSTDH